MDSFPPARGAAPIDDLLAGVDADADLTDEAEGSPADLPEVVEAVTGRARDLHRLADRLSVGAGGAPGGISGEEPGDGTLSAVALLRAHAGEVDALAEHLAAAGAEHPGSPSAGTDPGTAPRPGPRSLG
ncbi:hypothetical protein Acsp06_07850 [Actinomycetospora sp. NBRC 106375]|uniref:hypothetical protein n=1 Tax=Actinomycetospora sp. NBRC 106375 TaxID=3032207 RepID=UPI0024A18550|nr:hypothetical protein [Actinomycetospora sp. NBRC 106375]GLZ44600.1 hypothetical protein Acsp06_07850 [Actinomycetospora sp. NBRC 106375]